MGITVRHSDAEPSHWDRPSAGSTPPQHVPLQCDHEANKWRVVGRTRQRLQMLPLFDQ